MSTKIKDIYGDILEVEDIGADGSVFLVAIEKKTDETGRAELILNNDERKKLRKALKRS